MPYSPVRNIEYMNDGSLGKETMHNDFVLNAALGISGAATIALSATDHTLTTTNDGEGMRFVLILTGTLTANVNVIVPAESRVYVIDNRTTGAFTVTCRPAAGGGVAVDQSARTLIYCDGANVYPVASGTGGGGGSGAPTDASYLVGASHTLLSGERVVTDTATITWDLATAGQAKALIPPDAVTYTHLQNVTPTRLLGRYTAGAGDAQEITPGTGLTLDASGVLSATAVGQPLDATLTALAGLATGANQLPYATGTDTFSQTPLSAFARTVLDDADAATLRGTISAQASDATLTALAGVTTGADTLPFFTGVDTASTTTLTAFMRSVLDDPDLATAQATLGITGGGGSSDFLGLSDTPNSYGGQAGKGVVVNGAATGLDFTTAATGSYDLGLTWSGVLPASQVLMRYPFPRAVDFPVGLTGSQGRAAVAATALTTLELRKNNVSVGSVQFAAAGTTATFTMASATSFAAGDVLTVHAPASADATLADLGLSLAGTRAVVAGEMGATTWLGLTDTPDSYSGQAGKAVQVNAGATALELVTPPAAGHTDEQIQDLMATTLTNSSHIQWTYNDTLGNLSSDIYGSSIGTAELTNDGVTYAKIQNVSATDRMLGRFSAGAGDVEEAVCTPAGRALLDDADTAAQRTTLGLGTMAQQDASAVAITGGSAAFDTTVTGRGGFYRPTSAGDNQYALYTDMAAAGGTARYGLNLAGDAPNYLQGNVGIGMGPNPAKIALAFNPALGAGLAFYPSAATATPLYFFNNATVNVGSITTTASATAYNTSSDVRLKHAIAPLTGALDVVQALRPVAFRWNANDEPGEGFLAHELMRQVPAAVSGEPDAVHEDGSVKPQQVDHSRLVPWLTAACQELALQLAALTARVASLEEQLGL